MDATFLDIKQDADSRHTSVGLMSIIYEMGTDLDDIDRLWAEPNPIELTTIIRAVTALVESQHPIWDGDTLHWGESSLDVSTGEIS
jgi:hypothetical protein